MQPPARLIQQQSRRAQGPLGLAFFMCAGTSTSGSLPYRRPHARAMMPKTNVLDVGPTRQAGFEKWRRKAIIFYIFLSKNELYPFLA
jgi:hypothetical protein